MRRVWLPDIGLFEAVPNLGNGSCLFQAISQAICYSLKHHNDIRLATVDHMCSQRWSSKLKDLPNFWKQKMIVHWLNKETSSVNDDNRRHLSFLRILISNLCRITLIQKFIARRKAQRYHRIKGLLHSKISSQTSYVQDLQLIFREFMSRANEPATRFELEAAADRFRFHFDYLQTIPISKDRFKPFQHDVGNNNTSADANAMEGVGGGSPDLLPEIPLMPSIPVKLSMYQFHSCRNMGCTFPRSCPTYEHFFFLHSPMTSSSNDACKSTTLSLSPNKDECWHWELLLPISLIKNPVPLNRRMFGMEYTISDVNRRFVCDRDGQCHESLDSVAEAIDTFVQSNPGFLPPCDSQWPADDADDYTGCASILKDPVYQMYSRSQSNSNAVLKNREHIIIDFQESSEIS